MPDVIRYTCHRELLPMVEGALTANGYRIDLPRQQSLDDTTVLVMARGLTNILLTDAPHQERAVIEIWGWGRPFALQLLESLPIDLYRLSSLHLATERETDASLLIG